MTPNRNRIHDVLKALVDNGMNEWITDKDLAVLSGYPLTDVRYTMNAASTALKYEGILERQGHAGNWSYRAIAPIDFMTVGTRAGRKSGYQAKNLSKPLLAWAQQRNARTAFPLHQVCGALHIDNGQARPAIRRLVQQGSLVVAGPDSWRLADHIELVPKSKPAPVAPAAPTASDMRPMPDPYVAGARHATTIIPVSAEVQQDARTLLDALNQTTQKKVRTFEEAFEEALSALLLGKAVKTDMSTLKLALAFQKAAQALYDAHPAS